jgi:hypothetical protein
MLLLLREYVEMLKESGELDVLVPDLLLAMGLRPLSKAQVGVRQHGVDASAVGTDPETGEETLFLITIKPGDIGRADWDGSATAIRASLDEILDVFLTQRVAPERDYLPKRIVLCCGGELKQETQDNWNGYKRRNREEGRITFDLWDGDRLALLLERHLLDEYLFPPAVQSLMRKALSLLDQSVREPEFYYQLVERLLFPKETSASEALRTRKRQLKALRLASLCLGVVVRWSIDVENTRPAVLAAERTTLRAWDFLRQHDALEHADSKHAFTRIYAIYLQALGAYVDRVAPLCLIEDGLSGYSGSAEPLEYPLRAFEVVGIVATLGLNHYFLLAGHELSEEQKAPFEGVASATFHVITGIIRNNKAARTPLFDEHMIELALGTLLMSMIGETQEIRGWLVPVVNRMKEGYLRGKYFPVASDDYDDLIDLEMGVAQDKEKLMELSTILPAIAEWFAIFGFDDDYVGLCSLVKDIFTETDLQIWYPEKETEEVLYRGNASRTGFMFSSIELPETVDAMRARIQTLLDKHDVLDSLTCAKHGFPALGLIASRHFRTPIIPSYWQRGVRLQEEAKTA